ncbi:jg12891 [Pararge aegeria aegeria]|uniref:Jg12891 protein n=1 Tax=Pararge aegeria aegeria TaxID=348720 RepID=A0A8S4RXF2_9NEOP|nr:jg12891 [Pararge aegeria aegeria]
MLANPQRELLESPGKCMRLSPLQLGVGEDGGSREAREAELKLLELNSSGSASNLPAIPEKIKCFKIRSRASGKVSAFFLYAYRRALDGKMEAGRAFQSLAVRIRNEHAKRFVVYQPSNPALRFLLPSRIAVLRSEVIAGVIPGTRN